MNEATREHSEQVHYPAGEGENSNGVGESEHHHNQANRAAPIERTAKEHKQKGKKRPVPVPRKQSSKSSEASADRVYAPVSKSSMMNPNIAEANATFDEYAEEALAEPVHMWPPPSLSSNGEIH